MKPLPAVGDGSAAEVSEQRMQAEQFLCELSVAMPILPTNVTVVGTKLKKRKKARASGTLYLRTYCDILVLCLCYVISPSSPQWFTSLYRSAVEILYTLQVCFPRGTGGRLPCDFLAEHSLFEIASSFSHLSSVFILSRGVETQRACAQMAKAIRLIICSPATRPPVRPTVTQPDVQDSVGEGGGDAVPLVWSLATQSTLLDLHKLISKSEHSTGSSSGLLSSLELSSKLKILNARHVRNRSMFCGKRRGPKQFDVRKLEIVADLGTSDELCLLSRLAVSVAENMEKTLALKRKRSGNPAAEERVSSPTNNLSGKWVVKGERRLWHKRDNGLRRQISDLVTKVWNDASRSPAGGEVAVSSFQGASAVRKILVPCGSAAERWLLGKLWLQIHRVNDKLPMFDYRTATVISE
ncbi:unnamed protein product [Trypanosoma congolense IL3000]|uniref:WGS project CAEQ00000000 data, annotated contig 219 n=1 Tax=Trypanosoma congolense (strain IL3000) TaxID=1068625 RepID=F9WC69_TRYCI|nr:unnamed protein product [Trypanosoma congolense IL3000]